MAGRRPGAGSVRCPATVLGTSPKAGAALTSAVACLVLAGTLLQHRRRLLLLLIVLGSAALSPPAFNLLWTVQLNPYETLAHVSSCFLLMAVLSAMLNGAPILMALGLVFNVLLRLHQIDAGGRLIQVEKRGRAFVRVTPRETSCVS